MNLSVGVSAVLTASVSMFSYTLSPKHHLYDVLRNNYMIMIDDIFKNRFIVDSHLKDMHLFRTLRYWYIFPKYAFPDINFLLK